ncbi:MAG: sigma-70 family RNA polymerase sigma factor [Chloroflexi bacterium]|nr:sigma-70 family RNA polymerase sigma factor [Chloroflexota bacterium]
MSYGALSEEQLIALVQQGDRDALGELYDRRSKAVFGFALHLLRDMAKAEEVTQEVFLNVWLKARTFDPSRGGFNTWVMTMAHHKAIDQMRRIQRQRTALEEAAQDSLVHLDTSSDSPLMGAQKAQEAETVRKALETLPAEQRTVITLAYYQGLSQSEIATRLKQPLGTVKTRMRLAIQKLRVALAPFQEPT